MKVVAKAERGDLVLLVGAAQPVVETGGIPTDIQILPFPIWETDEGPLVTDAESQRLCLEHFRRRRTKLVVDYEHQTLEGVEAPAAGWITEMIAAAERGLRGIVGWTPRAAEYIANREYEYHSPVAIFHNVTRRVHAIHSIALTNTPKTQNQIPLSQQIAAKALAEFTTEEEKPMKEIIAKIKSVLGAGFATLTCKSARGLFKELAEAIPDEESLLSAKLEGSPKSLFSALGVIEASAVPVASKEVLELLELGDGATLAQIQAKVIELRTPADTVPRSELEALQAKVTELEAKTTEQSIEQFIASNRKRITPAREVFVREAFKKHGLDHVRQIVATWKDELPARQAGEEPKEEEQGTATLKGLPRGYDGYEVNSDGAAIAAKVKVIQKEKGCDYRTAVAELRKREAGT